MNILFINASPHGKGNISAMLGIMRSEAEKANAEIESVSISDLTVKPCTGCMSCRKSQRCALPEDDSQRVLAKIEACDAIIAGVPCYWGSMPGNLKVLFDRLAYGMLLDGKRGPQPRHKGKLAIIVSTCSTPWPFNILFNMSSGAINSVNTVLKYSGFKLVKAIQKGNTRDCGGLKPSEEASCRRAVRKLLEHASQSH